MAKNNNLTDFLTDVADAIRAKKGTSGKINPQDFANEIASIQTGSSDVVKNQDKSVTIESNGTQGVYPDIGYTGLSSVSITTNVQPKLEEKTESITTNGTKIITPTTGKDGISKVTIEVDVPTDETDVNIESSKAVSLTSRGATTIDPSSGYDAMAEVVVTPMVQSKTTTITENKEITITPDSGYVGLASHKIIVNVPDGGGGTTPIAPVESKDVNFYDYDGTLLYSYTTAEVAALTSLPPAPSAPEGLGLLSGSGTWNYTLDEIKDIGGMCDVGAMYASSNPYVTLVIETPYDGFLARFMIKSSLGNADVNWGDGNSSQVGGQDSYFEHTYEKAGRYTISYRCQNANATVTLGTQTNTTICGDKTNTSTYDYVRTSCLVGVIIGEKCGIQGTGYSFAYSGLRFCILSSKVQSIPQYTFQYCSQLKHITLPKSCSLGGNAFAYCGLKTISLGPEGGAGVAMGSNLFSSAIGLRRIVIPRHTSSELTLANFANTHGLTTMVIRRGWNFTSTQTFRSLNLLDLSDYDTVPTLGSTLTLPASCKIKVKSGLLSSFQNTTNWSNHSSKFVGV